jgi:hypothetical protein
MTRWASAAGVGFAVAVIAAGTAGPAAAQKAKSKAKAEPLPVNERVVEFARKKMGEQVGNGECWTLANDALLAAGGKSSPSYQDFPAKGDYVWGVLVFGVTAKDGKLTEEKTQVKWKVAPGDIVQFRDAKFAGPKPGGGTYSMTAPHHTAVVDQVSPDGLTLGVLHQNWGGKRTVGEAAIALRDLKDGWVKVYRPLPR